VSSGWGTTIYSREEGGLEEDIDYLALKISVLLLGTSVLLSNISVRLL
jgi:hypothetical protein